MAKCIVTTLAIWLHPVQGTTTVKSIVSPYIHICPNIVVLVTFFQKQNSVKVDVDEFVIDLG